MESKKINILGSAYTLAITSKNQNCRLKDADGICDETVKELLVDSYADSEGDPTCKKNLEEMVDFFAIQFPKLLETFKAADAL